MTAQCPPLLPRLSSCACPPLPLGLRSHECTQARNRAHTHTHARNACYRLQEVVEEEMGQVTDEEGPKSKGKGKGKKKGLKPGQALSFSGLEPRKWDGVDMLDMKQMIPRAIGGTFCMYSNKP